MIFRLGEDTLSVLIFLSDKLRHQMEGFAVLPLISKTKTHLQKNPLGGGNDDSPNVIELT